MCFGEFAFADLLFKTRDVPGGASIVISNTGDAPTQVLKVVSGCGLDKVDFTPQALAPDATLSVQISFATERPVGLSTSIVKVYSAGNSVAKVEIALPRADITTSEEQVFFGKVQVGAKAEKTIRIRGAFDAIESTDDSFVVARLNGEARISFVSKAVGRIRAAVKIKVKERVYTVPVLGEVLPAVLVEPPVIILGDLGLKRRGEFKVKLAPGIRLVGIKLREGSSLSATIKPSAVGGIGYVTAAGANANVDEGVELLLDGAPNYQLRVSGVAALR